MKILRCADLRVRALGGDDRDGGGTGPAIVLCHGYGAPGDDLVALAQAIEAGPGVRWFFPEAPNAVDIGYGVEGRAWWPIDMMKLQLEIASGKRRVWEEARTPPGMLEARAHFDAAFERLVEEHGVDPKRTLLGGFSQGAMLTLDVAIERKWPLAGLAAMSGAWINAERWDAALASTASALRIVQSHGRRDPILPFDVAVRLRDHLLGKGAAVDFVEFVGGHEIPPVVVEKVGAFARSLFT